MARDPRITLRGFQPGAGGLGAVFGALETAVMEILWREPGQTVTDVERRLQDSRDIARTTVLTTLDRLHRKRFLEREKRGKAFVYTPRLSREDFEHGMAREVVSALLSNFHAPALSAFVDLLGADPGALDRLEAAIRARRTNRATEGRPGPDRGRT